METNNYEIFKRNKWSGNDGVFTFQRIKKHSDSSYSNEAPCVLVTEIEKMNYDINDGLIVSFDVMLCEYDNNKSVILETDNKPISLFFLENGEIQIEGESTNKTYNIGEWLNVKIYLFDELIVYIDDELLIWTQNSNKCVNSVSLKTIGYPTFGPILESTIGISEISYINKKLNISDFSSPSQILETLVCKNKSIDEIIDVITWDKIAVMDNGSTRIRHSLNFFGIESDEFTIKYHSDNEKVVTESGRVIRPRYNEKEQTVKVDVIVGNSKIQKEKSFFVTVLPYEKYVDPGFMDDIEFFGKYENGEWIVKGKLEYQLMPAVEDSVKKGNYHEAKKELSQYFFNKKNYLRNVNIKSDFDKYQQVDDEVNSNYTEMILNDVHELQQGYLIGISNANEKRMNINTKLIEKNSTMTFSLRALYNEASKFYLNEKPLIVINTNKKTYEFQAADMVMIKAGEYADKNFSDEECYCEMYGDFLGNRTSYILTKFEFYGIGTDETVIDAYMTFNSIVSPEYVSDKRIFAVKEFSSIWESEKAKFSDFIYGVYSFEGLHDFNKWKQVRYAEGEYLWQSARFPFYKCILNEYDKTKNDELLYELKRILGEAINSFGGFKSINHRYTYNEDGIRGGYTRTLDAVYKLENWTYSLEYLAKLDDDGEFITAFLKHIWDTQNYLLTNAAVVLGNWTEFVYRGLFMTAGIIPELSRVIKEEDWAITCKDVFEYTINGCFMEDGSYKEGNSGYCQNALDNYINVKKKCINLGLNVSKEYDDRLNKASWYCANLFCANGDSIMYGDCINYPREYYNDWNEIYQLTKNDELLYLTSYAKEGIEPKSTLCHFPESKLTVMRSDYSKDAVYLFTDVKGGGGHSHADENSIILSAYGKLLLRDSGVFSYTASDPYRIWGISTRAHNTIEIDEHDQIKETFINHVPEGKVHFCTDDINCSKVSQSSYAYEFCEHKRTITFVKPDLFIVKDELIPNDEKEHVYDVLWHFQPRTSPFINGNYCKTNSENEANIKIIVKGDVELSLQKGVLDLSYGQVEEGEYLRTRAKGKEKTIITILAPLQPGEDRELSVEINDNIISVFEDKKIIYQEKDYGTNN